MQLLFLEYCNLKLTLTPSCEHRLQVLISVAMLSVLHSYGKYDKSKKEDKDQESIQ